MPIESLASPSRVVVGGLPQWLRLACWVVLTLASAAGVLAGCQSPPPRPLPREPSAVGVVRSVDFVEPAIALVTLATGQRVRIDFDTAARLYGGGGPKTGDLLLHGADALGAWYVALPPEGDTFRISTDLVGTGPGNTITFEFGLRLPLASTFHMGHGPFEPGAPADYRVNEKGEVTELE